MQIDGKFSTPRKAHDSLGTTRNVNRVRILIRVTARSLPDGRQSGSYPETGLWEAPKSGFRVQVESQRTLAESSASDRIAFAYGLGETGLRMCPLEKNRESDPNLSRAVRSLQSGLLGNYREKWACLAHFRGKRGGISLRLRLTGGGSVIRTRITVLNPATPDVLRNLQAV
jgi:hypothetical protein